MATVSVQATLDALIDGQLARWQFPHMTDEVRKLMNAEPFRPFFVKTSDGKQYRVRHPDFVAISPKGGRVTVYADEETSTTLSALHIVAVELLGARGRTR
jgi:hypothetical protein